MSNAIDRLKEQDQADELREMIARMRAEEDRLRATANDIKMDADDLCARLLALIDSGLAE